MATPNFMFGDITPGAAGGVIYNTSMTVIDALFSGVEELVFDEPSSPAEGEVFAVGDNAANEFSGQDDKIAIRLSNGWLFNDVAPGYVTMNQDNQCWLERGTGNWSHTAGVPAFFARMNSSQAVSTTSWISIYPWTSLSNVAEVFNIGEIADSDAHVQPETDEAGIFLVMLTGSATMTSGSASVFEIGIGIGSDTAEAGTVRSFQFDPANNVEYWNFSTMWIGVVGAGSGIYPSVRRTSGTGTMTIQDDDCAFVVLKLRIS